MRRASALVFTLMTLLVPGLGLIGLGGVTPARAQVTGSGLPLPRFVSLRAGEVNLRTGPGVQYPVEWVYRKSGLPIEIIAEYKTWRKVLDWDGDQGWIHQAMLSAKRSIIVTGKMRTLVASNNPKSRPVARVSVNVVGRLIACPQGGVMCQVVVEGYEGWIPRAYFWGVLKDETVE